MTDFAVVSDAHFLHTCGLTHPYVSECFTDFTKQVPKKAVGILNGDIFQGMDMRWIEELKLGTAPDEFLAARELLHKFYDRCSVVYSTSGTKSHSTAGLDLERVVNALFGSKIHKTQLYVRDKKTGWRLLFQHGRSAALIYKTSILERELRFAHEQAWKKKMPEIDCLVRSHLHECKAFYSLQDAACITPCFQLPTPYSESGSLGWKPDIGGLIIRLEKAKTAMRGIRFDPISYPLPDEFMEVIEVG